MYLSPAFEYYALKFTLDEMIEFRRKAADEHRGLASMVEKIVFPHFMRTAIQNVSEALNWIVFNRHETGIRDKYGDEKTQREIYELERKVADLINEGFITEYERLIDYLRKRYHEKNYPKIFNNRLRLSSATDQWAGFDLDEWGGQRETIQEQGTKK
jgi:hypothetical protein